MVFEDIRPFVSGLLGAIASIWLGRWLSRWLPSKVNGKSAETLAFENKVALRVGNGVMAVAMLTALALYQWGGVSPTDWWPLSFGVAIRALSAPLTIVPAVARLSGGSGREALAAYAITQKLPPIVIYSIAAAGIPLLLYSVWRVAWS